MTILIDEARTLSSATWRPACRFDDLEPGWGEAAWIDGTQVALYRFADGIVHAAGQRCPATGAQVMARGIMGSRMIDGTLVKTIASPLHKQVYRLDDGTCLGEPGLALPVYPVHVDDEGRVFVDLDGTERAGTEASA
ncbi:nitrite reductase small subunit NirD [Zafaria sp. Z1313]|uniref:nitrite reductase small subunit NirD n=1 Tax=unclassified Zafaria TaxID=2828765 RepID=UPI002E760D71|nr:nitrite reductase small subunit NirD [Zafaria sp. J156]MEE1621555.1 nitrite reductase small subunit NirD [Zafaria sp. J156]